MLPSAVVSLINELKLPGVGEKLPQICFKPDVAWTWGVEALSEALASVSRRQPCRECGFLADGELCMLCLDELRDQVLFAS